MLVMTSTCLTSRLLWWTAVCVRWANQDNDGGWTKGFIITAAALSQHADPQDSNGAGAGERGKDKSSSQCMWRFTPDLPACSQGGEQGDPMQYVKEEGSGVTLSGMRGSDGTTAALTIPNASVVMEPAKGEAAASKAGVWLRQQLVHNDVGAGADAETRCPWHLVKWS